MYVCVYVCICVCMYVCVCMCVYVCMYVYIETARSRFDPGEQASWDVMGLFKTHINSLQCFKSRQSTAVIAPSDFPALTFRLATVIAKL
jgi:hypothetical protein